MATLIHLARGALTAFSARSLPHCFGCTRPLQPGNASVNDAIFDIAYPSVLAKFMTGARTVTILLGAIMVGTTGCEQQPSKPAETARSTKNSQLADPTSTTPSAAANASTRSTSPSESTTAPSANAAPRDGQVDSSSLAESSSSNGAGSSPPVTTPSTGVLGRELNLTGEQLLGLLSGEPPSSGKELRIEGEKLMTALVGDLPSSLDALELRARWLFLIGDVGQASQMWQQAIRLNPTYGYALHGLGKVAVLEGDYAAAVDYFLRARNSLPAQADVVLDLAQTYMKTSEIGKVIELLESYLAVHPPTAELCLVQGQAHLMERQFEEAKVAFEKTLEISPNQPRAQQGLGTALVRLGRREEAKALLEAQKKVRSIVERNRTDKEILVDELAAASKLYELAAKLYLVEDKVARAQETLAAAIVLDRQNLDAWRTLITMMQNASSPELVAGIAERMCESNGENASCFYTLGVLKLKAGDVDATLAAFGDVIRLAPNEHTGYESLARILVQVGKNLDQALESAEKNVAIKPTAAAHELLAQVHAVRGELEPSIASLKRALELAPNHPEYSRSLEQLLQAQRGKQ